MQETLYPQQVQGRLRQLNAHYQRDRSTSLKHVYWSPSIQRWIAVERVGTLTRLTYSTTCPCSGS